ncbi:hypothetical protein C2E23DRAFT_116292 [Lenzites betulinus]|nr:hypothetical protein C2E23DRAFT_116292 [Lenzites betulinus]
MSCVTLNGKQTDTREKSAAISLGLFISPSTYWISYRRRSCARISDARQNVFIGSNCPKSRIYGVQSLYRLTPFMQVTPALPNARQRVGSVEGAVRTHLFLIVKSTKNTRLSCRLYSYLETLPIVRYTRLRICRKFIDNICTQGIRPKEWVGCGRIRGIRISLDPSSERIRSGRPSIVSSSTLCSSTRQQIYQVRANIGASSLLERFGGQTTL